MLFRKVRERFLKRNVRFARSAEQLYVINLSSDVVVDKDEKNTGDVLDLVGECPLFGRAINPEQM